MRLLTKLPGRRPRFFPGVPALTDNNQIIFSLTGFHKTTAFTALSQT